MKAFILLLALLIPRAGYCDALADALAVCRHLYRDTDTKVGAAYTRDREAAAAAKQKFAYVIASDGQSYLYSIEDDSLEKTVLGADEFSQRERLAPKDYGGQAFLVLRISTTPTAIECDLGLTFCHGRYLSFTREAETGRLINRRGVVKCCY